MLDSTLSITSKACKKTIQTVILGCMLACFVLVSTSHAQVSTAPFLENDGLVVMEVESVPWNNNWQFETTEPGFTGAGYLRYVGQNYFNEPGNNILEYKVVITNPGRYRMFVFSSHQGAPETDQENDVWTRMDNGEWIKTVHSGIYIDLGFSYHTSWVVFDDDGNEVFPNPEFDLEAGVHTFQISGRSWNFRIDRIHLWKDEPPNQVFYSEATDNTLPESERSNQILTIEPDPVAFAATPVGGATTLGVNLVNEGDEPINVTDVSIVGADAGQFSDGFTGSLQVPSSSTESLQLSFEPTVVGSKTAQVVITHDALNSPTTVNLFGSATSGGSGSTVLYRVNAGGALITDELGDWEEDRVVTVDHNVIDAELGTPNSKVNALATGDWSWGQNDIITIDPSVPPGTPVEMFQTGRWDPSANPQMQWDFPVESGKEVEVRLYFSEIRFTSLEDLEGPRIFSVLIDNFAFAGLNDIHLLEEVGHDVGIMRSAVVISDGNIDIDFVNNSSDPIIMGIELIELGSLSRNIDAGWNLVGIPTNPSNPAYTAVFDEVSLTTEPYLFENGAYVQSTDVEAGVGYWINVSDGGSQSFGDGSVNSLTLNLEAGWNLISGPGCFMAYDAISDVGNILIDGSLFAYDGNYTAASGLLPGFGYWIQASAAGTVTMDCASVGKGAAKSETGYNIEKFGQLNIRDAQGRSQSLYFGATLKEGDSIARYMLPPRAPVGRFDVRFNNNGWLSEGTEGYIAVQSDAFPVSVELVKMPGLVGDIIIEEITGNGFGDTYHVQAGDVITLTNSTVTALKISTGDTEEINVPSEFALKGNYPNPFNPSTQVVFDLPEAAAVQVDVFDMLGRRVMSLPVQELSAGAQHRVQIDAGDLASGIYLYTIEAQMASKTAYSTGRMTLLK